MGWRGLTNDQNAITAVFVRHEPKVAAAMRRSPVPGRRYQHNLVELPGSGSWLSVDARMLSV